MAIYCVAVRQAISVRDLAGDSLCTGTGTPDNRLSSCAAIVLFSQTTGAAALYHYPAGDITLRPNARGLIREIIIDVNPTHCYVAYGVREVDAFDERADVPSDFSHAALCEHLRPMLPEGTELRAVPAHSGVVVLSQNGGVPHLNFHDPTDVETDLKHHIANSYPDYTLYRADD